MSMERMAIAFLSQQQIWGITSSPVSNFTFAAISTESIRVLPEGESGNVTTSTFTFFKIWAASKSFSSSALTGGASSTAISFFCFGAPSGLRKNPPGRTPETSRVSKTPADAPGFWTVSIFSVNFNAAACNIVKPWQKRAYSGFATA